MYVMQKDIRGFQARYHRNGSHQESFFLCNFKFLNDEGKLIDMRAVVTEKFAAVMSQNINERWDGEAFRSALHEAIRLAAEHQPEIIYS